MTRRRAEPRRWVPTLALLASATACHAQGGGAPQGTVVQPRIGITQTWTDNLRLSEHDKDAALITTLSPGVHVVSNTGALRGSLDYTLNGIAYVKSDQPAQLQNALQAVAQAELIERSVYVDLQANIGQQSASAFGLQSTPTLGSQGSVSALADANRREVGTLSISPLWRGFVGSLASFELRGNYARTEVRGDSLGDSHGSGASLRFTGLNAGLLNWWLLASTQENVPTGVRSNRLSSAMAGLNYRPDVDWLLAASAGRERNNYLAGDAQSGVTGGMSAQWTPTPRTRVNADWQHHDYGNSHSLSLEHRLSRAVLRVSDSQAVTAGNTPGSGVQSNYDVFYAIYAALEPDPVRRDALVRLALAALSLSPDAPAGRGFLSAGPSLVRNQQASFALQGVRNAVTAQANRSITRQLGSGLNLGSLAGAARIEQRSYSLTGSHRLTPTAGVSLTASRQETLGDASSQANQLTSLTANWNGTLGPRFGVQLGARHSRFEGSTPYSENAVYGSLTQQF